MKMQIRGESMGDPQLICVAFIGDRLVAEGSLLEVALKVRTMPLKAEGILIFDAESGRQIDVDLSGSESDIKERFARLARAEAHLVAELSDSPSRRGAGRPKLGVVAREVTLLPRHWEWLNDQPGGASVALRKLVDEARKTHVERDRVRHTQEAAYRFMSAKAGNFEGFEEATRALFRSDKESFLQLTESWPADVRCFSRKLADFGGT
jgi:hypothetical protein